MMDFNGLQKKLAGQVLENDVKKTGLFSDIRFPHQQDKAHTAVSSVRQKFPYKKYPIKLVGFIVLFILAIVAVRATYRHIAYAGIDTSRYQAVYLTNDNVYFGKVHVEVNGDIFLTDVFRVQAESSSAGTTKGASSSTDNATADSSTIRLIKPGKEIHAPDDTMLIKQGNVRFIENLKTDGKVTQTILDYHKNSNQ